MNQTSITSLRNDDTPDVGIVFDDSVCSATIRRCALDLFIDLSIRIQYLLLYLEEEPDQFGELLSCIMGMYSFSRTIALKYYIMKMIDSKAIPLVHRIECAKTLDVDGVCYLDDLCTEMIKSDIPTPIRTDTIIYFMQRKETVYHEKACNQLCILVTDQHLESLYRLKVLQSIEHRIDKQYATFYMEKALVCFMNHAPTVLFYRVVCAQYICQKCKTNIDDARLFLLNIAEQITIDEDIRADACDILLAYGTDSQIEQARLLLFVLGGGERARANVFTNSQNVHHQSIEESVEKLIEVISVYVPTKKKMFNVPYTFEEVKDELNQLIRVHPQQKILEESMIRIVIDRATYGKMNLTLASILTKMWIYIQDSEYCDALTERLLEELVDSTNKCSSGYVARIVNALSGFNNLSVQIGFADQISAVLETRLNSKINAMPDGPEVDLILEEMIIPVQFYEKRGSFLRFFRTHISEIREAMAEEYKDDISTFDFDLYFRQAIMHYEGFTD